MQAAWKHPNPSGLALVLLVTALVAVAAVDDASSVVERGTSLDRNGLADRPPREARAAITIELRCRGTGKRRLEIPGLGTVSHASLDNHAGRVLAGVHGVCNASVDRVCRRFVPDRMSQSATRALSDVQVLTALLLGECPRLELLPGDLE